jgi:ribosomal subunit interface protein
MQVLLNSDHNIRGDLRLTDIVEGEVERVLGRFDDYVTRVEVHLNDVNSPTKTGSDDKRCQMEARIKGLDPVSATHHAPSLMEAISGACEKLERALERHLGRLEGRKTHQRKSQDST